MTYLFRDSRVQICSILDLTPQAILEGVLASQPELAAWETWATGDYTIEKAEQFMVDCTRGWDGKSSITFALCDPINAKLIGTSTIRLANSENNFANLGYWVDSCCTKQGIASTAATEVAKFAFQQLGYTRIEIVAQVHNLASRRVAEKVGATFEGIARNRLVYVGQPKDAAIYSLVPEDVHG